MVLCSVFSRRCDTVGDLTADCTLESFFFPCSSPFLSSTGDEGWASRGEQEEMAPSLACLSEAAAFLVLSEEQIAYLTHGHVSVSIWCPTHSGALGLYVGPWRYPAYLPASHLVPAPCQSGSSHTHPDHQRQVVGPCVAGMQSSDSCSYGRVLSRSRELCMLRWDVAAMI